MNITEFIAELQRLQEEHGDIEIWAAPAFIPEMKVTCVAFADAGQLPTLRTLCPRDYDYPPRVVLEMKDPTP
jgi:hypothetical protein